MLPAFPRSRRLPPGKSGPGPSRAPAWSAAPVGRRGRLLHVFIDVQKLRLDLHPHRCRGRLPAACASTTSADRCFNEHCLGPPEHPGPAESWPGRLPLSIDRRLSIEATAEGTQGQGPRITEPRRSLPGLLPRETSPQPRSLLAPRVAVIACHPARSGRGCLTKPPAPRTLARHAQREGRATPDLREEIRRSPTRGAFRRKAVRERTWRSTRVSRFERPM